MTTNEITEKLADPTGRGTLEVLNWLAANRPQQFDTVKMEFGPVENAIWLELEWAGELVEAAQ